MKDAFSSFFAMDDDKRDRLWQECIFVFDTNVLTAVYKRSDEARDALYKVIGSLGDRLWIPHQVAFEFLDNRANIAHTQSGIYAEAIVNIRNVVESFEVSTRHPFLSEELNSEFINISKKVVEELELKRQFHDSRITKDDVKAQLACLLEGKVGGGYDTSKLKEIVKEGELRYANQVPPGFEDIKKHKGSNVFSEICKRYGDLIIWRQVIEKAKEIDKPVIFVTGEQKEDWWEKCGGKTIGPLPALVAEFESEVNQNFTMYSYHRFLDLANEYLHQNTSAEVIAEVREAALDDALAVASSEETIESIVSADSVYALTRNRMYRTRPSARQNVAALDAQARLLKSSVAGIQAQKDSLRRVLAQISPADADQLHKSRRIYREIALADARLVDLDRKILDLESRISILHHEASGHI